MTYHVSGETINPYSLTHYVTQQFSNDSTIYQFYKITYGCWFGVAVMAFVTATKLSYIEPG